MKSRKYTSVCHSIEWQKVFHLIWDVIWTDCPSLRGHKSPALILELTNRGHVFFFNTMTSNHKATASSSTLSQKPQLLPSLGEGGLSFRISWKIILYICRYSEEILTQLSLYLCAHVKYASAIIHRFSSQFWHLDFSSVRNLSCRCIGVWWEREWKPLTDDQMPWEASHNGIPFKLLNDFLGW